MSKQALQRLLEGNRRYVANQPILDESPRRRSEVAQGQKPVAIIFGCVDSRVPPELIFDQGLGDLFVIRTAGEVLDQAVLGSLEFGVEELHIPLLVVLGHERCGAVKAAIEVLGWHGKAEADIEAAKSRVLAEESNYFPTISANGAYNWQSGSQEFGSFKSDLQNTWNAGVMLTVPLFQGGLTRGRVSEARANLLAIEVQRDATRQSILLEVNQSYADMESAKVRIQVMESTLQKARENLETAQGRYEAGVGPYIEVTDAQLSAVNSEMDRVQAMYDYFLAIARLIKAMGRDWESEHKI